MSTERLVLLLNGVTTNLGYMIMLFFQRIVVIHVCDACRKSWLKKSLTSSLKVRTGSRHTRAANCSTALSCMTCTGEGLRSGGSSGAVIISFSEPVYGTGPGGTVQAADWEFGVEGGVAASAD